MLIGFNESVTFQGNPTISRKADLNKIHIKEALGCNSKRDSPQEDEELIILWFCDLHRQAAEAEITGKKKKWKREAEQKKQVWKKDFKWSKF